MVSSRAKKAAVVITAVLAGIANLLYLTANNLHPDEAYYWVWSHHLQAGYFDNSPLIAYVIRLFTVVGGHSEFWVRLPALLGWVFFLCFTYFFTRKVYRDADAARLGVLIAIFVPLVATGSHIMTPDIILMFFAAPAWYFLYLAIVEEKRMAWYAAGLFFGLALLAKFQAVLIALAAAVVILGTPGKRKLLGRKEPYLAVLLGVLIFTPVLYWNWTHQWAAFAFQGQHGIEQKIRLMHEVRFVISQFGVFSPLLFGALLYYTGKSLAGRKPVSAGDGFLVGSWLAVFLFFCLTSLTHAAGPNWPAVGYMPALVFLGGWMNRSFKTLHGWPRRLLAVYLGCALAVGLGIVALLRYPGFFKSRIGLDATALTDTSYGWAQLGREVDAVLNRQFPTGARIPVFGDVTYDVPSELAYYVKRPVDIFTTRQTRRSEFDYDIVRKIARYDGQGGLLVLHGQVPANAGLYFTGIEYLETFSVRRYGREVLRLYIYRFRALDAGALYEMTAHKPLGYPGTYPD